MLVLITYDVNTTDADGKRRLRQVAKKCVMHGQRVQNSVFECLLDAAQYRLLKAELSRLIDAQKDSLRFYELGNRYESKVEHVGAKATYEPEGILMI
ncbi:MAG: CRISPR-associated endonuclease Cas2 [Clostridia bacterium]|nr:CRISPR-associated endonuclease Cas2 [Clostridia bacterium]